MSKSSFVLLFHVTDCHRFFTYFFAKRRETRVKSLIFHSIKKDSDFSGRKTKKFQAFFYFSLLNVKRFLGRKKCQQVEEKRAISSFVFLGFFSLITRDAGGDNRKRAQEQKRSPGGVSSKINFDQRCHVTIAPSLIYLMQTSKLSIKCIFLLFSLDSIKAGKIGETKKINLEDLQCTILQ